MRILRAIASLLYQAGVVVRHWFYDSGMLHKEHFDMPVICVGNITVGGTGKTPTVEYLVRYLGAEHKVAVLSRGYGRRSKGFVEVKEESPFLTVGDEPKQVKRKFPDVPVVVCEDRTEGIRRIRETFPEVEIIIMDDGFQHRRVVPKVNIILSDYTRPIDHDYMLPYGTLRDVPSQLHRANIFLITKTPTHLTPIARNIALKSLRLYPYQTAFLTDMQYGELQPAFPDVAVNDTKNKRVVAFSGIGNPKVFVNALSERYEVVDTEAFPDHHVYRVEDVKRIAGKLEKLGDDVIAVTTEKDAVKLTNRKKLPEILQRRLFVMPVFLNFRDGDEGKFLSVLYQNMTAEN